MEDMYNAVDVACDADMCARLGNVGMFYRNMTIEQAEYIAEDTEELWYGNR